MKLSLFQGILLGVFGIAALVGLFVFATYTSTGGPTAAIGKVVIWGILPHQGVDTALALISRDDTSLKGVSYVEKDPASFDAELTSAIAEGVPPDLVLLSHEDFFTMQKLLAPIPASSVTLRTFADTFAEGGELFYAPDGSGSFGLPALIDPLVLYENRTILSSVGISTPPSTWEALTGLVPKITTLTSSQNVSRALIALGTYKNVENARGILSALFLQTGVPIVRVQPDGRLSAVLTGVNTSGISAGSAVLRFYTQFADPSKISYTWNESLPSSTQFFLSGDSALYIGLASEARFLNQANPNLNFDVAPLPQPATANAKLTYGVVYAFSIPRGAKNASGALAAASALLSQKSDQILAQSTGLAPSLRALLSTTPSDPVAAVAYPSALYAKAWLSPAPASTDALFSGMIQNVISGRLTLDAALAAGERSLAALLSQ